MALFVLVSKHSFDKNKKATYINNLKIQHLVKVTLCDGN